MPPENLDIVRKFYDSWAHSELPGPRELLDPKVEYVNPPGAIEPGIRRGIEAFNHAVDAVAAISAELLSELETTAPPKNREVEAAKARARAAQRYAA